MCVCVCVCVSLACDSSETIEVIIIKLGMVTALDPESGSVDEVGGRHQGFGIFEASKFVSQHCPIWPVLNCEVLLLRAGGRTVLEPALGSVGLYPTGSCWV